MQALPPTANSARFPAREAAEGVPGAGRGMKCTSAAYAALPPDLRETSHSEASRGRVAAPGFSAAWGHTQPPCRSLPPALTAWWDSQTWCPLVRQCCAALYWAPISVAPSDCSEQQVKPERGGLALGSSAGGSSLHFRDFRRTAAPRPARFLLLAAFPGCHSGLCSRIRHPRPLRFPTPVVSSDTDFAPIMHSRAKLDCALWTSRWSTRLCCGTLVLANF